MLNKTKIILYIATVAFEVEGCFGDQVLYAGTNVADAFRVIREFNGEAFLNSMTTEETPRLYRGYVTEDDGDREVNEIYQKSEWYKYTAFEDGGTLLFTITKTQAEI